VIVTLGRYLVYGLLSAILFTLGGSGPRRMLRQHWRTALAFALAGNAAYYLLLVIGIRAAGAPLTDMAYLTPDLLRSGLCFTAGPPRPSPRTVSHHLYRAFPKLGVTNRTALARLDLTGPDDLP
jgi:hypothetical protein